MSKQITKNTTEQIADDISRRTGKRLYYEPGHNYLADHAESLLVGRSHYYDAQTRKSFGCRVLHLKTFCDGLILGTIESVSHPTLGRCFRHVFFDLLGDVIGRPAIEDSAKTSKTAEKRFNEFAATLPATDVEAKRVLQIAIERNEREKLQLLGKR